MHMYTTIACISSCKSKVTTAPNAKCIFRMIILSSGYGDGLRMVMCR